VRPLEAAGAGTVALAEIERVLGCGETRGLHSSTFQLNLSWFCHRLPNLSRLLPQKVLMLSKNKGDECVPLVWARHEPCATYCATVCQVVPVPSEASSRQFCVRGCAVRLLPLRMLGRSESQSKIHPLR
jgi:hypothetical protein